VPRRSKQIGEQRSIVCRSRARAEQGPEPKARAGADAALLTPFEGLATPGSAGARPLPPYVSFHGTATLVGDCRQASGTTLQRWRNQRIRQRQAGALRGGRCWPFWRLACSSDAAATGP